MATSVYDLLVIGAGSGGVRAARASAAKGARVAIFEHRYLGGTCVNVGCVPKKLFYYASHYAEDARDATGYGWSFGKTRFTWQHLLAAKNDEILRLNAVYDELLNDAGVTVISGRARLTGPHSVICDGCEYTARHILLATGAWPYVPEIPGRELAITSNEIFHIEALPGRIAIVGGGYIAAEFAGILNGLGVNTELIHRGSLLLRHFDHELGRLITDEMRRKGVTIRLQTEVKQLAKGRGGLQLTLSGGEHLVTDMVLFATGRRPATADLGLEHTRVRTGEDGAILVDAYYRTDEPSIFAIGDIIGGPELTPLATAQGMAISDNLFGGARRAVSLENVPTAVFCQPSVGTVGLSEARARERYRRVDTYTTRFRALKHALSGNDEQTFMKLVVDADSDRVLGVHMIGPEAGEIVQGMAIALNAGATKTIFDRTIGIHPTSAEEFVTMRQPSG